MFSLSNRPQRISEVMGDIFKLYGNVFKKIWGIALLLGILAFIPSFAQFAAGSQQLNPTEVVHSVEGAAPNAHMPVWYWVVFVASVVLMIYFMLTLMHRVYALAKDPNAELGTSLSVALRKFFPLVVAWIVLGLIMIVIGALFFVLPVYLGGGMHGAPGDTGMHLGIHHFFFFAIGALVYFYFLAFCVFVAPAILFDDKGPFSGIKQSFKYLWGNWWNSMSSLYITYWIVIGMLILSIPLMVPFIMLAKLSGLFILLALLCVAVGYMLGIPYLKCYFAVQYNNLAQRYHEKHKG